MLIEGGGAGGGGEGRLGGVSAGILSEFISIVWRCEGTAWRSGGVCVDYA